MDVLYAFIKSQELRALIEPTSRPDAATAIFNLPDYRVTGTEVLAFGQRRIRRCHRRGRLPSVRRDQHPRSFPPPTTSARHPCRRAGRSALGQAEILLR